VDYGGVRNVLAALGDRPAAIALMTSIGVTNRAGSYNQATQDGTSTGFATPPPWRGPTSRNAGPSIGTGVAPGTAARRLPAVGCSD
jgi:hypothetical protein